MNVKSRIIAIVVGALVTLALGATALTVLPACYHGNVPTLPAVLAAFLCPLVGGYLATRLARVQELVTGAISGLVAGLAVLLVAAVASSLAPNTTLAAVLLAVISAAGGALGAWLTRVRLSLELA